MQRRFCPCGRCGSVHLTVKKTDFGFTCECSDCGKKSYPKKSMRESYNSWQQKI